MGKECLVCMKHYDYFIQLERIDEELPVVLRQILKHDRFPKPGKPKDKQKNEKLIEYLRQVPPELVFHVLQDFKIDYELFGYRFPQTAEDLYDWD